jgi:hypothetical protein
VGGIFRSLSLPRFAWALVRSVCFLLVDIGSSTHRFVGARLCSSRDRIHPKAKASVRLIDWGSALLKEMHNRPVRPPLAPPASAGSDATRTPFELPLRPSAPSLRLAPECAPNRYAIPLGPANWGLGAWKQRLKNTRGGGGAAAFESPAPLLPTREWAKVHPRQVAFRQLPHGPSVGSAHRRPEVLLLSTWPWQAGSWGLGETKHKPRGSCASARTELLRAAQAAPPPRGPGGGGSRQGFVEWGEAPSA